MRFLLSLVLICLSAFPVREIFAIGVKLSTRSHVAARQKFAINVDYGDPICDEWCAKRVDKAQICGVNPEQLQYVHRQKWKNVLFLIVTKSAFVEVFTYQNNFHARDSQRESSRSARGCQEIINPLQSVGEFTLKQTRINQVNLFS